MSDESATDRGAALITGCSSGMGRAIALRLHRAGRPVYATARDLAALKDLAESGLRTRRLDLREPESMAEVVAEIEAEHGFVAALVNNAGYGLNGTIEHAPHEAVREQFEVNLFGPVELIRLVLPGMRRHGEGRIVNVSSFFGRFGTAGRGYYQATKHGLEAVSDALRYEVAGMGVRVVLIQPGPTFSSFFSSSDATLGRTDESGPYAAFWREFDAWHEPYRHPERPRGRGRFAVTPDEVAAAVERALTARNPRPRYPVGLLAHALLMVHRTLPARAFDRFVRAIFPVPAPGIPR